MLPINIKACAWFMLARVSLRGIHSLRAQHGYERISSLFTQVQIAKAQRFARTWRPKPATKTAVSDHRETNEGLAQ